MYLFLAQGGRYFFYERIFFKKNIQTQLCFSTLKSTNWTEHPKKDKNSKVQKVDGYKLKSTKWADHPKKDENSEVQKMDGYKLKSTN